jgi:lambda repressor-like predicted transcriptional regulator
LNLEEKLSKCIDDKGIALTVVSRRTGISYMALYDSLRNKSKKRDIIRKRTG